jgi:hypothetical protein
MTLGNFGSCTTELTRSVVQLTMTVPLIPERNIRRATTG